MKKVTAFLKSAVILCFFITLARPLGAVTISAGPVVWFSWWNPIFEDQLRGKELSTFGTLWAHTNFRMNPAFLYGPVLSIGAGSWSVSSVFTMGTFHAESRGIVIQTAPSIATLPLQTTQNVKKYDLDVTLNYRFTEMVKLFWGFKYQRYGWSSRMNTGVFSQNIDNTINAYSTGFGVSLSFQITGNLYMLGNISVIYLLNTNQFDKLLFGPSLAIPSSENNMDHGVGGNGTLSLAYFFEPISTTISLGFRYQYIRFLTKRDPSLSFSGNPRDQFYGVTLSAVYSFEI